MKKERKTVHSKIGKGCRILVEGPVFTMQRRWLGLFWYDCYRFVQDHDKHVLIPTQDEP